MKSAFRQFSAHAFRLAATWLCFSFSSVASPFSSFAAQEDFLLLGVVRNADDESGVQGVTVRIVGLDKSFVTTDGGEYRIPISRNFIGRPITLQVSKPGWTVVNRGALSLVVLADQLAKPHRIVLRRITAGAPRKGAGGAAKPNPEIIEIRQLMDTATLLKGRGLNEASLQKYEEALAAIRKARARPQKEEMECLTEMSWLQMLLGDYGQARNSLKAAQPLAVMLRSDKHFARALNLLADLERIQGNNDLARQHYGEARGLFQKEQNRLGEANALLGLGDLERKLGNNDAARQHYGEARGLFQKEQNRLGEANVLRGLGHLESTLGNTDAARQHYGEARGLHQKVGDRLGEANVLKGLGDLETSLKNYDVARQHYHHANGLYLKEDNRLGIANICWSFGDLERALGNKQAAREQYDKAAGIFMTMGMEQAAAEMKKRSAALDK
ncbi:MAG: tetratricopeptide repeat protein [Blastocatellia bacterium]